MVAAGTGNDEVMAARNIRPLFEGDELSAGVDEVSEVTERALEDGASDD
jgi:acetolactate synthase-1/2/3 large subunit